MFDRQNPARPLYISPILCYNDLKQERQVLAMKTIGTHFTEQVFLDRLARFCRQKAPRDKGYTNTDTFVCARKDKKFWIGKHYAHAGRSDGYANERLNCTYRVNDSGHVTVSYRFGKHPALLLPHIIILAIGLPMAVSMVIDAINHEWNFMSSGIVVLFFIIFGVVGFFGSAKEKAAQEEHLRYICGVLNDETDGSVAETDTLDVSDISDGDVYPVCIEYGEATYLTLYYYTGNGDGLLHDAQSIIGFRDEAQMHRFCLSHELHVAADTVTYHFDDPVTDARDHSHILNRWNLLNTMAEMLNLPFEGNDHAHDALYELLFAMSLPADPSVVFTDFDDAQTAELETVFASQDTLLARFRPYYE